MKNTFIVLVLCIASGCDYHNAESIVEPNALIGSWRSETVLLNGVNSKEYVDYLNDGFHMSIRDNQTFIKNYLNGTWQLNQYTLVFKPNEYVQRDPVKASIIEISGDKLVLEFRLTESEYCCNFDHFDESEVITIREIYKRTN